MGLMNLFYPHFARTDRYLTRGAFVVFAASF